MTAKFELPLAEVRPVRVRDLRESALCFPYDKYGVHMLVDRIEDDVKVILLTGDRAFHSYEIGASCNWKGLAVANYRLVVDLSSAIDTENEWPPLGALSMTADGVKLRVEELNRYSFSDTNDLKLSLPCTTLTPGLQASFTRWGFQLGDKDRPQYFWIESPTAGCSD